MAHDSDELTGKVMDLLLDAVCVVDRDDRYIYVGGACEAIFGYRADEMIGKPMYDFIHPDDRDRTAAAAENVVAGASHLHFRNRYVRKDGSVVHIMWSARRLNGGLRLGVARDVTELVRAESMQAAMYAISEAAHEAKDLVALFRRIHGIVAELLPAGHFVIALRDDQSDTPHFPYGFGEDDAGSKPDLAVIEPFCARIIHGGEPMPSHDTADATDDGDGGARAWLGVPLRSQRGIVGALAIRHRPGAAPYSDKDRELLQFVSTQIATAIERKQAEIRLQHLALHDVLTGLPNRELFRDRLNTALIRAQRQQGRMALLYIDLDEFKEVNDGFGHAIGDLLLRQVANRLTSCVRESDTVARIGGDEFVIVLDEIGAPEDAALVAAKIRAVLASPFELAHHRVPISSSIGIAVHPEDGADSETLKRRADAAMYEDKCCGEEGRSGSAPLGPWNNATAR